MSPKAVFCHLFYLNICFINHTHRYVEGHFERYPMQVDFFRRQMSHLDIRLEVEIYQCSLDYIGKNGLYLHITSVQRLYDIPTE